MSMVKFDSRWIGEHGIGRFAREIDQRLNLPSLNMSGNPSSPLEPLRLFLFMLFKMGKAKAVFSPGYNAPLFFFRPYIFTVHDLNHIDRPENSSVMKRLYYRLIMRRACIKAHRVLTVSEFSRNRIATWAGIDIDKVVNVGNGVDESYHPHVTPWDPGYRYFLCVSNRKAHKNELRVLEAFSLSEIDTDIRLVFTGNENESTRLKIEALNLSERVIFSGRVPEENLPSLYTGSLALLFPSLYEGFGLPVIEAMACGIPVLTSNTTCLPEIAGDAAILVDPESVSEMVKGIRELFYNQKLRMQMRDKGFVQARKFSWDKTAEKVNSVITKL